MTALIADIRLNRWSLHLTLEDRSEAGWSSSEAALAELAAAALAPALAALDPGGDEILVIDRLILPPLHLGPRDNSQTLARYARDAAPVAQAAPGQQRLGGAHAALARFALAVARQEGASLWLWQALGFLGQGEGLGSMAERLAERLALIGPEAALVLWQAQRQVPVAGLLRPMPTGVLIRLAQALDGGALAVPSGSSLAAGRADALAAGGMQGGRVGRPVSGRLARAWLRRAAPAFLEMEAVPEAPRAEALARIALAMTGALALPLGVRQRLAASTVAQFAGQSGAAGGGSRPTVPGGATEVAAEALGKQLSRESAAQRPTVRPMGVQRPATVGQREEDTALAVRLETRRAGLLFLLPLMPEGGLFAAPPARIFDKGGLTGRLVLLASRGLDVALDDPALRAFAGLWPGRVAGDEDAAAALPEPRTSRAALRETARLVSGLQACLARRRPTGLTLDEIVARRGWLSFGPAEIDLHLPLDEVDIGIRRAGLDASPGFLPWLGAVVRVHYEER